MPNLLILMGPPGSGKSTYAKAYEDKGYTRISQDDMGKDHLDYFHDCISTGRDVIVDRMGFNQEQRNRYRNYAVASDLGYKISIVEFVTPRSVCFHRCMEREGHPTINDIGGRVSTRFDPSAYYVDTEKKKNGANNALDHYFKNYETIDDSEYSEVLRIYWNAPEKMDAIMCDLDGTLCNLNHRLHYVKGEGKKDWNSFFNECDKDEVYEDVADILGDIQSVNGEWGKSREIIFCSGRPDNYKDKTQKWLEKNSLYGCPLIMRPRDNYKPDHITKQMLYMYEIKPYYNIKFVLDDRDTVCSMWRKIGLSCFQVRPGNF